jgi:hypothetical protein
VPRLPPTTSTTTTITEVTTTTTTTTVAATTTTSTSTTTATTATTAPVDPVAIELTAGCDGPTGFVDAAVTANVDLVGVQLELRRMLIQSDPLAVETVGDMPAGTTASARWVTTGGFTYSVDVLANGEFVGNAVAGMDPCAGSPPPAATPAPAALPATR